jgi:chromosome segregation ATPase
LKAELSPFQKQWMRRCELLAEVDEEKAQKKLLAAKLKKLTRQYAKKLTATRSLVDDERRGVVREEAGVHKCSQRIHLIQTNAQNLQHQILNLEKDIVSSRQNLEYLRKDMFDVDTRHGIVSSELVDMKEQYESVLSSQRQDLDEIQSTEKVLSEKIRSKTLELESVRNEIKQLRSELDDLNDELSTLTPRDSVKPVFG